MPSPSTARPVLRRPRRCILCGRCVDARPDLFAFDPTVEVAADRRDALVVGPGLEVWPSRRGRRRSAPRPSRPPPADPGAAPLGAHPPRRRRLRRRRGVGGRRARQSRLRRPAPRHLLHRQPPPRRPAAGDRGRHRRDGRARFAAPGRRCPSPKVVVAAGADAISGGLVEPTYATRGGIGGIVPVDVWVPGRRPARSASCTASCSASACSAPPTDTRHSGDPGAPARRLVYLGRRRSRRPRRGGRPAPRPDPSLPGWRASAAAACAAAGVRRRPRTPSVVDLGSTLGMGRTVIRLDPLAGLFLTLVGGLGRGHLGLSGQLGPTTRTAPRATAPPPATCSCSGGGGHRGRRRRLHLPLRLGSAHRLLLHPRRDPPSRPPPGRASVGHPRRSAS